MLSKAEEFLAISGLSVEAKVENQLIQLGSEKWLLKSGLKVPENIAVADPASTVVHVVRDGSWIGLLECQDELRTESKSFVKFATRQGREIAILSGDRSRVVQSAALELGVQNWNAELYPLDKAKKIEQWQGQKQLVLFVGDGMNDALSLTKADVGVTLRSGTGWL